MPEARITQLWAWVSAADGPRPAPIGAMTPMGPMPLIHTQRAFVEKLRPLAQSHANQTKQPVQLVCFESVVTHETLEPEE